MQGVIKAYDPNTKTGVVVCDTDMTEFDLAADALEGSVFRMLRQGQRVIFDLADNQATRLRLGSEVDMGTPSFLLPDNRSYAAKTADVPTSDEATSTPHTT